MSALPSVTIYCDGACPSSGPRAQCGGWSNIIIWDGQETVRVGREYPSTNNRMELLSLIDALQALVVPCEVTFYSDSELLVNGTNHHLNAWIKRNWHSSDYQKIKNRDLWEKVDASRKIHHIQGCWIKGHIGPYFVGRTIHHDYNERCDEMAVAQSIRMSKEK